MKNKKVMPENAITMKPERNKLNTIGLVPDENQEEGFTRTKIDKTPFEVISYGNNKHFGVFGAYKITDDAQTKEEIIESLQEISWNRFIQIAAIVSDIITNEKQK